MSASEFKGDWARRSGLSFEKSCILKESRLCNANFICCHLNFFLSQRCSPLLENRPMKRKTRKAPIIHLPMGQHSLMNNEDILSYVVEFFGDKQYLFFAKVSKSWNNAWGQRPKVTSYATPQSSVSQLLQSFECGLLAQSQLALCRSVARVGSLALLQWARKKGCPWDESTCTVAAGTNHCRCNF